MHIVDELILERAPRLAASPFWPLLRPGLYRVLNYRKARTMADAIAALPGREALDHVSDLLAVQVSVSGLERIPREGRFVAVCNHPTGIADGVALYDVIKPVRPDLVFYANSDALRVAPRFGEVLIPVEWRPHLRTRERTRLTLLETRRVLEAEAPLVIFPAGMLARRTGPGQARDPEWAPSAFSVARKYDAPIVPMHLAGPWPTLFHFFDRFSKELRDITLFHELLNKHGGAFKLTIGPVIPPAALPGDAGEAALAAKTYVEEVLAGAPDRPFA
jgi:putative hemolysin